MLDGSGIIAQYHPATFLHTNLLNFLKLLNTIRSHAYRDYQSCAAFKEKSASFSSRVPNTEKKMKAGRRRQTAFIVSRCLEPLMKNEARVFELASQMQQ